MLLTSSSQVDSLRGKMASNPPGVRASRADPLRAGPLRRTFRSAPSPLSPLAHSPAAQTLEKSHLTTTPPQPSHRSHPHPLQPPDPIWRPVRSSVDRTETLLRRLKRFLGCVPCRSTFCPATSCDFGDTHGRTRGNSIGTNVAAFTSE